VNTFAGHLKKILIPNELRQDTNQQSADITATNNVTNDIIYIKETQNIMQDNFKPRKAPELTKL
jgi:hypothetical protein